MGKEEVEKLRDKYQEVKEEQVEKAADKILNEVDEEKMKRWEFIYQDNAIKEYEGIKKVLDSYDFPERIPEYDQTARVLFLLSEVYRLTGEVKGLKARGQI